MARKGILSGEIPKKSERPRSAAAARMMPKGAVGALQSSLTKLQENAVQEVDPSLIDAAGVEDRLGVDSTAMTQLKESLRTYGQQVPVLLRPNANAPGRYEIVYGRRRLLALKELGLPVKAMVRQLDDHALVLAQGQENTARQDLSFIERASFAAQLQASDYERQTIADALSIDLPMVSRLLKVGNAFDMTFLRAIGSAPSIGRDRWMALVERMKAKDAQARVATLMDSAEFETLNSDQRFDAVFERAGVSEKAPKPPTPSKPRPITAADGAALGDIRMSPKGITLTIANRNAADFGSWMYENADQLIAELHDQWKKNRSED